MDGQNNGPEEGGFVKDMTCDGAKALLDETLAFGRSVFNKDDVLQWRQDHGLPEGAAHAIADFVLSRTSLFDFDVRKDGYINTVAVIEGLTRAAGAALPMTLEFEGALSLKSLGAKSRLEQCANDYRERGRFPYAFASTEYAGGSNATPSETTVSREFGSPVLNGRKAFVNNGEFSPLLLVSAVDVQAREAGVAHPTTLWLIDQSVEGVRAVPIKKTGQDLLPFAEISFTNAALDEGDCLLAASNESTSIFTTMYDNGRLIGCASCLGLAQAAMDDACERVSQRRTFGRALREYQLMEELIVRMEVNIRSMKALVYDAARAMDAGEGYHEKVALAKWFTPRASVEVASDAMQIFGASGYTSQEREFGIWADCRAYQIASGTDQIMVDVAAPIVIDRYCR